jgi:acyl-CoA synthetase (AMP-forming)/AMP-acid ligase II
VVAGDRVLWQLPNTPVALILHDAVISLGAVSVPVPMLYREHELEYIIGDAQPAAVVVPSTYRDRTVPAELERVLAKTGVAPRVLGSVGDSVGGWDTVPDDAGLDSFEIDPRPPPVEGDAPVLIMYTSGSTANPKGVIHTSSSLASAARMITEWCGLGPDDCFITGAPVAHVAGLLAVGILPLLNGGKAVLLPRWDTRQAATLIDQEQATFSCGATVFLQDLVDLYEAEDGFEHRLGRFICGGATIPPSLIPRADEQGIFAFRSWGMTEAPMIGMARPDDPMEIRSQSDGRVCSGATVEAVDEDRRSLPDGTVGELRLRAAQQMAGYTDADITADQVDLEGWFYSGDLGFVKDGVLTMTGRLKDIINRGGEKFSAQDIENAISDHPSVSAVAVISVPDERLGEAVAAAVELRAGELWPGDEAVSSFLADRGLARPKIPQHWYVLATLPRTASGKIRKEVLRAELGGGVG